MPHAILHYLPFAVLSASEGKRGRFLVDDYVVGYLPAAAALVYGGKASRAGRSVLAMSPSSTRLRYTQQESQNVSALFPKEHMLLLGNRATESTFKRLAGRYDVVHLATHGYFNKLNPLLSGIALEPDAENDGRLELRQTDKATALAKAQRSIHARGRYTHPYYWGAFALVGQMQ